ncbi:MAG: hypothetical protein V1855_00420, partial [bacterium]
MKNLIKKITIALLSICLFVLGEGMGAKKKTKQPAPFKQTTIWQQEIAAILMSYGQNVALNIDAFSKLQRNIRLLKSGIEKNTYSGTMAEFVGEIKSRFKSAKLESQLSITDQGNIYDARIDTYEKNLLDNLSVKNVLQLLQLYKILFGKIDQKAINQRLKNLSPWQLEDISSDGIITFKNTTTQQVVTVQDPDIKLKNLQQQFKSSIEKYDQNQTDETIKEMKILLFQMLNSGASAKDIGLAIRNGAPNKKPLLPTSKKLPSTLFNTVFKKMNLEFDDPLKTVGYAIDKNRQLSRRDLTTITWKNATATLQTQLKNLSDALLEEINNEFKNSFAVLRKNLTKEGVETYEKNLQKISAIVPKNWLDDQYKYIKQCSETIQQAEDQKREIEEKER